MLCRGNRHERQVSIRTFFDKYTLVKVFHVNEKATIYLVRHMQLDSLRIIKAISKEHMVSHRSYREAHILKSLVHTSIPICYDIEEDERFIYIIEEYIDGVSLHSYIATHNKIPATDIISFFLKLCDVLGYLHSLDPCIIHLDIKPDNIIVRPDKRIELIDFGNAIYENDIIDTSTGTEGFASPEQYKSLTPDRRSDIYSLGAVMLYVCTGSYDCSCISKVSDKGLKDIISKCLRHEPSMRYNSVYEITEQLNQLKTTTQKGSPLKIDVFGISHGIGVTHTCIVLSLALRYAGYKVLLQESHEGTSLSRLMESEGAVLENGTYFFKGIFIMPYCYDCITDYHKRDFNIIIYDKGCDKTESSEADIRIAVGSVSSHKIVDSVEFLRQLSPKDAIIFVANLTDSGNTRLRLTTGYNNTFAVPYINYDRFCQNDLKALSPLIRKLLPKPQKKSVFLFLRNVFKRN